MTNIAARFACVLLMLVLLASSVLGAEYTVTLDTNDPLVAEATLRLPPGGRQARKLVLRGASWGLQSQVAEVTGEHAPLESPASGQWIVPADCNTVRWKIQLRDSATGPIQASSQESIYFRKERFWLISEPTALLRLENDTDQSTLMIHPQNLPQVGAMPSDDHRWRIPAADHAPEFFVAGHIQPTVVDLNGFNVTYIADDVERVRKLDLQSNHASVFRYLLGLFPALRTVPASERKLMLIWVGVDAENKHIGGAAGSRSFVANYVHGEPTRGDELAASNLMVAAHEQFHQLTDLCCREDLSLPTWVNESLAQYYGLKALKASSLPANALSQTHARFISPNRAVEDGLLELSRRFKTGDKSVYPLFYSQGSTFWAEVDRVLGESTGGEQSLDDLVPILLKSKFDESGALPKAFLDALRQRTGTAANSILQKYVGA